MSMIGMPAPATISSVQKSVASSWSVRSPAGIGWAGRYVLGSVVGTTEAAVGSINVPPWSLGGSASGRPERYTGYPPERLRILKRGSISPKTILGDESATGVTVLLGRIGGTCHAGDLTRQEPSEERVQGIADYEFIRPLGESNYGTNYLANAPARLGIPAEEVVVKVIAGPTSDDAFRRATRELKHFSVADSDRLVAVYDAGRHGGAFYYAMEYL